MTATTPPRLSTSTLRAAIVDLDGTMVDTLGDFVAALQRMLADLPEPYASFCVTPSLVERLVGKGSENLIKGLLSRVQRAQPAIDSVAIYELAWARYQHHYQAINGLHSVVYPGVLEGLDRLRARGWPMACVTNKPTAFARTLLAQKGLADYFGVVLGGDAVARKKPDPMALQLACQQMGVAPQQALMVGDSSNDAEAARAAGCPVVLVTYGYNHGEPVQGVDADAYTDSLAAIPWG